MWQGHRASEPRNALLAFSSFSVPATSSRGVPVGRAENTPGRTDKTRERRVKRKETKRQTEKEKEKKDRKELRTVGLTDEQMKGQAEGRKEVDVNALSVIRGHLRMREGDSRHEDRA